MTTLAANVLTLSDWAKRVDPDGKVPAIVEILDQTNEILIDAQFKEGNLATGHQSTIRTGLPAVYWRLVNQGVLPSKSRTAQVTDGCGMLEAWSEVDQTLCELNGMTAEFRLSEAKPFLEAMNQEFASTLMYGNSSVSPEEFNGLAIRYSVIASGSPENAQNILDAGGTGSDNASVWLVVWGESTVHCIFPKGAKAGLDQSDRGLETVDNVGGVTGAKMLAYRERFQWKVGLAVKDWRYVVRICNIDISLLVANASPISLTNFMIKAMHRIPNFQAGKPAFYMNRTLLEMLDIQRRADVGTGGQLKYEDVDGRPVLSFRGIPIRKVDVLLEAEARVV